MILIRVLHVLLGVFWAGALFFQVLFLEPVVRGLGADGGKVMQGLQKRRFFPTLISIAVLTIVTGMVLYYRFTEGFSAQWLRSRFGIMIGIGATAGLLTLLLGFFITRPTLNKLNALAASLASAGRPPSDAERAALAALQTRLRVVARVAALLLLIAVATMAVGRHG